MATEAQMNMRVKYIPDTSALQNLKELKMPQVKFGGKDLGASYNKAVKDLQKAASKGADPGTLKKAFEAVRSEATELEANIRRVKKESEDFFAGSINQSRLQEYKALEKEMKAIERESTKRRSKTGELRTLKQQTKMTTNQAKLTVESAEKGEKVDKSRLENAQKILKLEQEIAETRTQSELKGQAVNVRTRMKNISEVLYTGEAHAKDVEAMGEALVNLGSGGDIASKGAQKAGQALTQLKKETDEAKTEVIKFGDILATSLLGVSVSSLLQSSLNKGISFFKDYDETLTRTMMVTGQTREEVNSLTASYNELANQLSSTTKDVADAQLVFYQQGLSTEEALKMTEASIAVSKTGGIEAAEAADRLTAAVRGYKLAASDAMDIADKLSAVDAAAASSVDEMTVAMQKSASQARMAGLDLDYYIAYLSTMQEVTREAPENIGTAMKSITSRLQEIKDIGKIEEDGTSFSNVAKALNSVGIAAVDSAGQLRDLQGIMNDLGPMWATLDRNHQAYIATVLAGNRQQSRFIALMDNYDRAMELVSISQNASGNTAKQLRAYNTGLEASFKKLTNAWQQFATKITDSSAITELIDAFTKLIEKVNSLPAPLLKAVAGFWALSKATKVITSIRKVQWGTELKKLFNINEIEDGSKEVKKWGDSIFSVVQTMKKGAKDTQNFFKSFKEGVPQIENSSLALQENANSTKLSTESKVEEQSEMMANNLTKVEEVDENKDLKESQEGLKTAVDDTTESIRKQNDVYTENGTEKLRELETTQRRTKLERKNLEKQKKDIIQKNKDIVAEWQAKVQSQRTAYEASIDPAALRAEAEADLQKEGLIKNIQMSFFPDSFDSKKEEKLIQDRMKKLKEMYGQGYHYVLEELRDQAMSELGPNNVLVDQLNEAIEEAKKAEKRNAAAITREQKKYKAKKNKDKDNTPTKDLADGAGEAAQGVEKVDSKLGKLRTGLNKTQDVVKELNITSKAFSAFAIGSLVSMAVNYIPGVNDELAKMVGTLAGAIKFAKDLGPSLDKVFPSLGGKGSLVAFGVEAAVLMTVKAFTAIDDAAESAEKNLNKSLDAWDKTSEAYTNIRKLSDIYNELSGKINKTTEEQESLNSAIQELAEIAPKAVIGYDLQGNAILDASKIDEAVNEKRVENAEKANDTVLKSVKKANADAAKEAEDLQDKLERGGATAVSALSGAGLGLAFGGPVGAVIGGLVGSVAGYFSSKEVVRQMKRDAKAQALYSTLQEQSSTIVKGITEQSASAILEGAEEGSQSRQELSAYLVRGSFNEFTKELIRKQKESDLSDKDIERLTNQYQADMNDAFLRLSEIGGLDRINDVITTIQSEINKGASWSSVADALDGQLNSIFATAGIDDETAEKLVSGIQTKIFSAMSGNIPEMQAQVQSIIDQIKTKDKKADTTQLENIKAGLANLNQGAAGALESTGLLSKLTDPESSALVEELLEKTDEFNVAAIGLNGTLNQNGATISMLNYLYSTLGNEMEGVKTDAIKSVINSLQSTVAPTFAEIASTAESAISTFNTLIEVMDKLKETGGRMDLSTFTELFNVLDGIEAAALSDFGNIDQYTAAFGQLANGISEVNGEIIVQANAISALADIQRLSFIATMKQKLQEVEIAIEENKFEQQLVDAQIEALKKGLAYEGDVAGAKLVIQEELNKQLNDLGANWLTDESTRYANYVGLVNKALSEAANSFNKYYTAIRTGDFSEFGEKELKTADQVLNTIKQGFITSTVKSLDGVSSEKFNEVVKAQISGLEEVKDKLKQEGNALAAKKNLLSSIIGVAEKGNGALSKFSSDSANSASDYNEQLERTLTLLEKIAGLTHKLSKIENFQSLYEGWNGKKEGEYLLANLKTSEAIYDAQKDLFDLRQEMVNQAAGDLLDSPYGYLFDITEEGDIGWADLSKFEEYKNLPDDMQEDIDGLVQAFQEQRDALRDTELEMVEYAKTVKEAREEIKDLTIEAENTIVEAVKNREKILHDARQKALDDEIDMIEKAVEARKKAQEDDKSNKELYKAQEALRRATLDSSGKNNAQLLQLQQDLEDKQLEIAEKRFEDDMDDRKQWLQDTKDAETETYEYRLEQMTWYWEQVQEIMESSTEEIMNFLITWNADYQQQSATQQEQLKEQWESTFTKLKTITESLNDPIDQLKTRLSDVTSEIENQSIKIEALAGQWEKATEAKQNYANTSSGGGTGGGGGRTTTDTEDRNGGDDDALPEGKKTGGGDSTPTARYKIGDSVESKKIGAFSKLKKYGWDSGSNSFVDKYATDQSFLFGGTLKFKVEDVKYSGGEFYYKEKGSYNNWIKESDLKGGNRAFAKGGYVDYTGPAWVDGTKTKPEAFLSAYQTEQIGALAKALDPTTVNNATSNSNITFGSVNFNVASMSSAADGKKALEVFVQGANDMMAKKGIGTKLNLNVK